MVKLVIKIKLLFISDNLFLNKDKDDVSHLNSDTKVYPYKS